MRVVFHHRGARAAAAVLLALVASVTVAAATAAVAPEDKAGVAAADDSPESAAIGATGRPDVPGIAWKMAWQVPVWKSIHVGARELDLVVVSLLDLGFDVEEVVALEDIHARADMLGFVLCPAETGPQLRMQYADQPRGELLHVAMRPIAGRAGEPTAFTVVNSGGLILVGEDARPNSSYAATARFIFVRPRPKPDETWPFD